jgi:ketosteroid isomerase-like protein
MNDLTLVRHVMDHVVSEDLDSVLDLVAQDVSLTVLRPGVGPGTFEQRSGKEAFFEYFAVLGGIVRFWQLRFFDQERRVLVLGQERYMTTVGIESATEFALVCQVRNGGIAEILIVEDLTLLLAGRLRPTVYLPHLSADSELATA